MGSWRTLSLIGLAALMSGSRVAHAVPALTLEGHGRETGGLAVSNLGDTLWVVGRVTDVEANPGLPYSPAQCEYTFAITGLISSGEHGEGFNRIVVYSGGQLAIYSDSQFNADWLAPQTAAEPPACFRDGELWFVAAVQVCYRVYSSQHAGGLYCQFEAVGGTALSWLDELRWFFGEREETPGDLVALGYELTLAGRMSTWWEDPMPNGWGAIKALY